MRHERFRALKPAARSLGAVLLTGALLFSATGSALGDDVPGETDEWVATIQEDDEGNPAEGGLVEEDASENPAEENPAEPEGGNDGEGREGENGGGQTGDDEAGATERHGKPIGTEDDGDDAGDEGIGAGTVMTPLNTIDSATGNWRYWMTNSNPGRNGSIEPEQTITYNLRADGGGLFSTVTGAQAYLTLTDDVGGDLLEHVTLQPGSGPGEMAVDGNVGTWTLPNLNSSWSSRHGTFTAMVGTDAPDGATLTATITGNGRGSLRGSGLFTPRYGTVSHTVDRNISEITVSTATVRTGTGANDVAAAHTEGARFALFTNQSDADPIDEEWAVCTTSADGECVFTGVETPRGQTFWIGALDPELGSPAADQVVPFDALTTGSGNNFTDRTYRFQTPNLNGGNYTVPGSGSGWSASSGYLAHRLANPTLPQTCEGGLSLALVMDLSGSVAPHRDTYRDAAKGFVSALQDTGSSVALFSFGNASPRFGTSNQVASLDVDSNLSTLNSQIDEYHSRMQSGQGTNWDAGMWAAAQGASTHDYDLVVVLTDGNPTYSMPGTTGSGSDTTFRELERAVFSANAVKDAGTRVVSVGIGANLSDYNLAAISGPVGYQGGGGLNDADYFNTGWSNLEDALEDFADGITCRANVTVTKMAESYGGTLAPASGWDFSATLTGPGTVSPESPQTTGQDGTTEFDVDFDYMDETTNIRLAEQIQDDQAGDGWQLDEDVLCTINDGQQFSLTADADNGVTLEGVGVGDQVECTFTNVQNRVPDVEIVKEGWTHEGGDPIPPGSELSSGTEVAWSYTVTNTGETPLKDIEVTDDQGVAVTCPATELDAGDSMTCWGSGLVTAVDP